MKRLALSLICGFAIPFLYTTVIGPLTPYVNRTLDRFAMYPVRWPILMLYQITLANGSNLPFESETAKIIYIVGSNVLAYSVLSYVLFFAFSKRKKSKSRLPPNPSSNIIE